MRWVNSPVDIVIVGIFYDGVKDQEGDEYVVIRNEDLRSVQLEGWTLHDSWSNHVFTFPRYEMSPEEECRVYTNEDHSEWCGFNFRWGGSGVWNNEGDMATLRNADGVTIDTSIDSILMPDDEVVSHPFGRVETGVWKANGIMQKALVAMIKRDFPLLARHTYVFAADLDKKKITSVKYCRFNGDKKCYTILTVSCYSTSIKNLYDKDFDKIHYHSRFLQIYYGNVSNLSV